LYCHYLVATSGKTAPTRRREPRRPGSRGKQIVRWAVVFFAVGMLIDAIVGERGLLTMLQAREQYEAATTALAQQRAENERLRDEVKRLKASWD
jgi:cell division protein FtsB